MSTFPDTFSDSLFSSGSQPVTSWEGEGSGSRRSSSGSSTLSCHSPPRCVVRPGDTVDLLHSQSSFSSCWPFVSYSAEPWIFIIAGWSVSQWVSLTDCKALKQTLLSVLPWMCLVLGFGAFAFLFFFFYPLYFPSSSQGQVPAPLPLRSLHCPWAEYITSSLYSLHISCMQSITWRLKAQTHEPDCLGSIPVLPLNRRCNLESVTSLCLSVFICKMGIKIATTHGNVESLKVVNRVLRIVPDTW